MSTGQDVRVHISGVSKRFGGVQALDDVSFDLRAGDIVGLAGENGSGKSTLIKILTGVYSPDEGEVVVGGEAIHGSSRTSRVAVVHQDLGLVDELSVADNVGVGVGFGTRVLAPIPQRRETALSRAVLDELQLNLDLATPVSSLSASERAITAIVRTIRSLSGECDLLILDEPTAYLSAADAHIVLDLIRTVAATGAAVLFVSHRLGEVVDVANRIVVLRDGQLVAEFANDEATADMIVTAMLGRSLDRFYPEPPVLVPGAPVALKASGISGGRIDDISFTVHEGEILGITGLTGMGQEELPYLLTGAVSRRSGDVVLADGTPASTHPRALLKQGVILVPGNRQRDGVWLDVSATENISLPVLGRYFNRARISAKDERRDAQALMERFKVRPPLPELSAASFSGGNQQKIVLAKWLRNDPRILLLDEPTQGVDAGARHDILEIVVEMAAAGAAVVIFSSDYEQLANMCHRVLVCQYGAISAELDGDISEHRINVACQSVA
jgi:ribose transport system ATP-binding protein